MKILSIILFLLITVNCYGASINVEQKYFRFYNDDGSTANNHTARASENVNIGATPEGNIILRIELAFTGSTTGASTRVLQVSVDGGAFNSLWNGTYMYMSFTPSYNDRALTTSRLTPTGSFYTGEAKETSNATGMVTFSPPSYVEDQWCFQFTEAAIGHTFAFRSFAVGIPSQTYTAVPTIKVNPAITLEGGPCFIEI